ncbi:MAG: AAA family ATPase [Candidatus Ratteibacteria bacterium]
MEMYYKLVGKCSILKKTIDKNSDILDIEEDDLMSFPGFDEGFKPDIHKATLTRPKRKTKQEIIEKIEKLINEIEEVYNELKSYSSYLPIIEKMDGLDKIERCIVYYKIGSINKRNSFFKLNNYDTLLKILADFDETRFAELKLKYLNPSSNLFKRKLLTEDEFEFSPFEKLIFKIEKEEKKEIVYGENLYNNLYEYVSKRVIGHEEAKRQLIFYFSEYIKNIENEKYKKDNILLIGPTGTGKTFLIKTIAEYLKIPFVYCDITEYTDTGYVGKSVSGILSNLKWQIESQKLDKIYGIVFIDEIDKIAGKNFASGKDISGYSVQEELLNILEGDTYKIEGIFNSAEIDIKNIVFVAAGVFRGIENSINGKRSKNIGFLKNQDEEIYTEEELPDILEKFGLLRELIGRFGIIIKLDNLTKQDFKNILFNSESSPLKEYETKFKEYGIEIELKEDMVEKIIEKAMNMRIGARALRHVLNSLLLPYLCKIKDGGLKTSKILI